MAPSGSSTLTIQPWARQNDGSGRNVADVLARADRGHMRDITAAALQEEMAAEGALEPSDGSESEGEEGEEEEGHADAHGAKGVLAVVGKPVDRNQLYAARKYMYNSIYFAREEVKFALDAMSLAVSKDLPRQAQATMSAEVRERVPSGTLGVDVWQRMPADTAREAQDALLAANVKMDALQHAADGLLGAARRMQDCVRRETQYWDQLLSVAARGWNVCRVPGQQHRLGVRFGFSESAPQFSRKGIAALHPDREGGVRLERGLGSKPRALRAVLRRDGQVVGQSRLPAMQDADETTLEARIRHARDSLFDEELYHEMIRESRTLHALGVSVEGSTIHLRNLSSNTQATHPLQLSFDLLPLDQDNSLPSADNENEDNLAQAALLATRLLLTQAHRERLRKRSEPPRPLSEKQKEDAKPLLPILRPLLSLMLHHTALTHLSHHLDTLSATLHAAKIPHDLHKPSPATQDDLPNSAEALLTSTLLRPPTSTGSLTLASANFTFTLTTPPHSQSLYTLSTPALAKPYTTPSSSTFASALSALLTTALATAIRPEGEEWRLRADEAVVEREGGARQLRVELDDDATALRAVCSGQGAGEVLRWESSGEGKEEGFLEACRARLEG